MTADQTYLNSYVSEVDAKAFLETLPDGDERLVYLLSLTPEERIRFLAALDYAERLIDAKVIFANRERP